MKAVILGTAVLWKDLSIATEDAITRRTGTGRGHLQVGTDKICNTEWGLRGKEQEGSVDGLPLGIPRGPRDAWERSSWGCEVLSNTTGKPD